MPIYAIDHIQLSMPPGEEQAARDFYVGVLGFAEVAKPPQLAGRGGTWFQQGAVRLHLGVEPGFQPSKKAHPALLVDDLAAVLEVCRQHSVIVTRDVPLEGYDRAHILDPFGNRIELMQRLPSA
jgi:catechol 2,3-dioxygenase-like lactoylglutathione lyase family enzyme